MAFAAKVNDGHLWKISADSKGDDEFKENFDSIVSNLKNLGFTVPHADKVQYSFLIVAVDEDIDRKIQNLINGETLHIVLNRKHY